MHIGRRAWTRSSARSGSGPWSRGNALPRAAEAWSRHAQRIAAERALHGTLISLAALLGSDVRDASGRRVGRVRDLVVRWTQAADHPQVVTIVLRSGRSDLSIAARRVDVSAPGTVRLRSTGAYVRRPERHPADVALAHDVLDRQLVDVDGLDMLRPSDVYLAVVDGRVELIGIELGAGALLRRIGPRRLRGRVRPRRVIDWATVRGFAPARPEGVAAAGRRADLAGRAGTGLALDGASGEVPRRSASEVQAALEAARRRTGDGEA